MLTLDTSDWRDIFSLVESGPTFKPLIVMQQPSVVGCCFACSYSAALNTNNIQYSQQSSADSGVAVAQERERE